MLGEEQRLLIWVRFRWHPFWSKVASVLVSGLSQPTCKSLSNMCWLLCDILNLLLRTPVFLGVELIYTLVVV